MNEKVGSNRLETINGGRVLAVDVYTAYVSVGNNLKAQYLYELCMGKLVVIAQRTKMAAGIFPHII